MREASETGKQIISGPGQTARLEQPGGSPRLLAAELSKWELLASNLGPLLRRERSVQKITHFTPICPPRALPPIAAVFCSLDSHFLSQSALEQGIRPPRSTPSCSIFGPATEGSIPVCSFPDFFCLMRSWWWNGPSQEMEIPWWLLSGSSMPSLQTLS